MTATDPTEAGLRAAVLARPDDDTPRLVFADWLDERGRVGACPGCDGEGHKESRWRIAEMNQDEYGTSFSTCPICRGSGEVSDGRREWAEFIRVQCELTGLPSCLTPSVGARESGSGKPFACWQCRPRDKTDCLPWCEVCGRQDDLRRREQELLRDIPRTLLGEPDGLRPALLDGKCGYRLPDTSPAAPGPFIEATFSRGFVESVACDLATFLGVRCRRCTDGLVGPVNDREPCPECPDAHPGYRTPGIAPALFRSQPVERVTLTDRRPNGWAAEYGSSEWVWTVKSDEQIETPGDIPRELFNLLQGGRKNRDNWACRYPTREAALSAFSSAAVAYGRTAAGLPPLTPALR